MGKQKSNKILVKFDKSHNSNVGVSIFVTGWDKVTNYSNTHLGVFIYDFLDVAGDNHDS